MKKIAFVITKSELGGAQTHVLELAVALSGRGFYIVVLTGGRGPLAEALTEQGIDCRILKHLIHPIRPWRDLLALREIKAEIKKIKPDLVTTHSSKAGWLGRVAAYSYKIPVTFTCHGWIVNSKVNERFKSLYWRLERWASRLVDRIITVSESDFRLGENWGIDPAKMNTIHNGLPDLPEDMRGSAKLKPPRLIMVARFEAPKDHLVLLRALDGIKNKSWSLELVGDGSLRPDAEKLAGELGLNGRVTFRGDCTDVPERLAASQIFILTSHHEGFPITILEAMRAGLPVIASDVGGVREAVLEGRTGFLIPRGDVEMLRLRLSDLIDSPDLRNSMGTAGRSLFEERFTLNNMLEQTVALYKELLLC